MSRPICEGLNVVELGSGSIAASLAAQNDLLLEKSAAFEDLSRALKSKEAALEAARAGVYSAMTESAAEKTRIANIESRIQHLDEQDHAAHDESGELAKKQEGLKALLAKKEEEIGQTASRRAALQEEHVRVTARLEEAVARKKMLDEELGTTKNRLAGQNSRLHSLIELEQSLEGYQKGVQTVMAAKKQSASERVGTVHGSRGGYHRDGTEI